MEKFVSKQNLLEIPTLIKLRNDIAIIFTGEYIMAFDNIIVVEFFYDANLISEQLLCDLGG